MMVNFSESDHPIFRASGAFGRGELRSKGGGKKAIHFNGSDENIELLLRTVISANQRSVYGDTTEIPTVRSIAETHANAQQRKTWYKNTRENSNNCPKTRNYLFHVPKRV